MIKTTRKQREALFSIFQRDFPGWITVTTRHEGTRCPHCGEWSSREIVKVPSLQWRSFRRKVRAYPLVGDPCIMLPWAGMWLGIEADGHTHS